MCAEPALPLVLVIEDEPIIRWDVVSELVARGWSVMAATTGEEALDLTKAHDVAVVFTDIQLGGKMCGWQVGEEVRKVRPGIPILYASGTATDHARAVDGGILFCEALRSRRSHRNLSAGLRRLVLRSSRSQQPR